MIWLSKDEKQQNDGLKECGHISISEHDLVRVLSKTT